MKQNLPKWKGEIDKLTSAVRDFSTPSVIN